MKVTNEITKNNWDFTLYKTDEDFVMNVVFHSSAVDFSRSFRVSESEANQDLESLKQLSKKIVKIMKLIKIERLHSCKKIINTGLDVFAKKKNMRE